MFRRRVVTRSKKRKKINGEQCATSPYWADKRLRAIVMEVG
jgi:hypothetical protein